MITFPVLPGVEINLFLLILIGLGAGILSGFTGVGGAFVITPALIVLGFPANFAVGTSLAWVLGNSLIGTIRHGKMGNVDVKLGLLLLVAAIGGVEVGVRILNRVRYIGLADKAVLSISICVLLIVGIYTLSESIIRKRKLDKMLARKEKLPLDMRATFLSRKFQGINLPPRLRFAGSGVTMSLWIILAIGFFVGVLSGVIGVGGGLIIVPSLVYLVGLSSFMAVGTSLFQIIFSAGYGSIRHTMSGNVIIFAAFIMVVASSIGVLFGASVTRYVRGVSVRMILGISTLLFAVGAILKLSSILLEETAAWLEAGSMVVTFGSLGLTLIMIIALFITALRYHRGQHIPAWAESLVAKAD
jgi:uncharacterized membrane protein YfcA